MAKKRSAKPKKKAAVKVVRGKFAATTKAGKRAEKIAAARAVKPKKANESSPGRVTTFKPNGASSMEPLPEPTPLDLGPILLPDPDDAVKVLRELAKMNDSAIQAKKVYDDLKDRTKSAKEKYDDLAEMVLTRLRVSTHASELPLFEERVEDQARMESAGAQGDVQDDEPETPGLIVPPVSNDPTETLKDEEIPF